MTQTKSPAARISPNRSYLRRQGPSKIPARAWRNLGAEASGSVTGPWWSSCAVGGGMGCNRTASPRRRSGTVRRSEVWRGTLGFGAARAWREGAGGSAGANYRPGGDLGVRAQGNRSEIPGEDRCGRCARKEGRRGTRLPGGPWLSASAGDARAEESGVVSGPSMRRWAERARRAGQRGER